eukprot:5145680-Prymnesium_polylepis.2
MWRLLCGRAVRQVYDRQRGAAHRHALHARARRGRLVWRPPLHLPEVPHRRRMPPPRATAMPPH